MAPVNGKDGKVMVAAATVASVSSWKADFGKETLEITAMGDAAKKRSAGLGDASGSFSCYFDPSDTNGQVVLNTAALAGTEVTLKLYTDSTHYYTGKAILKVGQSVSVGEIVKAEFSFENSDGVLWSYT